MFFDFKAATKFVSEVVHHYEKSAPTVSAWADDLYIRLNENTASVTLNELLQCQALLEEGGWMQPNYAANKIYHLMDRLGQDTTGHAGF